MLLGLIEALAAAVFYGSATIVQAIGVRHLSALPHGASLLDRLRAGRLYAVGLALDLLGFVATFVAVQRSPLFLVESAVASSVAITAVLATVFLHARLAGREWGALVVVALGLVALALSAHEGPPRHVGSQGELWILASTVPALAMAVAGYFDRNRHRSAMVLAVACGLGFGAVGIGSRVLDAVHPIWRVVLHPAAWTVAIGGIIGTVAYGYALERADVTSVSAVMFAVETVVPTLVGLAWLGDRVRDGFIPVMVAGLVLTLVGSIALAGRAEPGAGSDQSSRGAQPG